MSDDLDARKAARELVNSHLDPKRGRDDILQARRLLSKGKYSRAEPVLVLGIRKLETARDRLKDERLELIDRLQRSGVDPQGVLKLAQLELDDHLDIADKGYWEVIRQEWSWKEERILWIVNLGSIALIFLAILAGTLLWPYSPALIAIPIIVLPFAVTLLYFVILLAFMGHETKVRGIMGSPIGMSEYAQKRGTTLAGVVFWSITVLLVEPIDFLVAGRWKNKWKGKHL